MPRTHAECDVRLGRGARFGQEPSLRECKHAPVGEVVGDRSRRDRRLRVFQRLQAAEDVASQERDPAGMVRQNVQLSFTQRAVVTLAVAPSRVAWRDSAGDPSGVRPMLLFSLVNHGDVPIQMSFPRYEVICVRVRSQEQGLADTSWTILMPGVRNITLVMRQRFAEIIELPPGAARKAGRYRARVELCSGSAYGADVFFDVTR